MLVPFLLFLDLSMINTKLQLFLKLFFGLIPYKEFKISIFDDEFAACKQTGQVPQFWNGNF